MSSVGNYKGSKKVFYVERPFIYNKSYCEPYIQDVDACVFSCTYKHLRIVFPTFFDIVVTKTTPTPVSPSFCQSEKFFVEWVLYKLLLFVHNENINFLDYINLYAIYSSS